MRRTTFAALIVLTGVICATGAGAQTAAATSTGVAATVEGATIPVRLFDMYLSNAMEALSPDDPQRQALRGAIIEELIDRAIVEIEAKRRGLALADKLLTERHERWIARLGGRAQYESYLAWHRLTDDEFRRWVVAQELYGELLRGRLAEDVSVSDAEIRDFYDRTKADPALAELFVYPEKVRASHILIAARRAAVENEVQRQHGLSGAALQAAVAAEMQRRHQRADDLRRDLIAGADFADLARRWSEDLGSQRVGGDLGAFTRGMHAAAFDEAAFALETGAVSQVVQTEYGFHVIKVVWRSPRRTRALGEIRRAIEERLFTVKTADRLREWLQTRRRAAAIWIDPGYLPGVASHPSR